MKRFEAPTEPTGETIPDPYEERRAALTAERQKARREEQDYAAVRRNVEEFLSPPRQAPARQKDSGAGIDPGTKLFAAIYVFPWAFAELSDIMKIQTILKEAEPMTRGEALSLLFYCSVYHIVACAVASILLC